MRRRVIFIVVFFLFWLMFFELGRALFLVFHRELGSELSAGDWIHIMLYGARMDLSMAGYFTLIPSLILLILLPSPNAGKVIHVYAYFLMFISAILIVTDIELYTHWNFRLDATPLLYIGKDTPLSIAAGRLVFLVTVALLFFAFSAFVYYRLIARRFRVLEPCSWKWFPVPLLLTALLILPIRGGTGIAPLNTGMVYFHPTSLFANHAAVNVIWNVGYSLRKSDSRLPENIMDISEAARLMREIREQGTSLMPELLKTDRPDILLIILEGITSKTQGLTFQGQAVTPTLSRLREESLFFENFYASGTRTDKGIVAILNAYPTQPTVSIIKFPRKTQSLPFLSKTLSSSGYHTSFTYGGDIDFANFRSYLNNAKFDQVTSSSDFPDSLNASKWGVHDQYVFERVQEECAGLPRPFFKTVLTLSSHEPFEVPGKKIFKGQDEEALFLNSVHYTDRVLGEFLAEARTQPWWDSTLVIITADHGHRLPGDNDLTEPERYHIPMFWTGGAVKSGAHVISRYGSQTDLAATLLGQLNISSEEYVFSQNLGRSRRFNSALYIFNNGFGVVGDSTNMVFDHATGRWIRARGDTTQQHYGRAMIQQLYTDFNQR